VARQNQIENRQSFRRSNVAALIKASWRGLNNPAFSVAELLSENLWHRQMHHGPNTDFVELLFMFIPVYFIVRALLRPKLLDFRIRSPATAQDVRSRKPQRKLVVVIRDVRPWASPTRLRGSVRARHTCSAAVRRMMLEI
jgi:hypothetical protein